MRRRERWIACCIAMSLQVAATMGYGSLVSASEFELQEEVLFEETADVEAPAEESFELSQEETFELPSEELLAEEVAEYELGDSDSEFVEEEGLFEEDTLEDETLLLEEIENEELEANLIQLYVGDTFTLNAPSGLTGYTYKYLVHNKDNDSWFLLNGFSDKTSHTWTATSAGNREFFIDMKAPNGVVTRSNAFNVLVVENPNALSLKLNVDKQTAQVGETVRFNAEASGGSGNYTYRYIIYNRDTNGWWGMSQFTENPEYLWNATTAGNRDFFVEVKDASGTVLRTKAVNVLVKASTTPLSMSTSIDKTTVELGEAVKLKSTVTGGAGDYRYRCVIFNKATGATWNSPFSTNPEYTWKASSLGDRVFYMEVKDASGTILRSKALDVSVKEKVQPLSMQFSVDKTSVEVGSNVVLSTQMTGGTGDYTYTYKAFDYNANSWKILSYKSKSSTYTWTAPSEGTWDFYVDVEDGSGAQIESKVIQVTASAAMEPFSVKTSIDRTEVEVGGNVLLKVEATGGKGNYLFTYRAYNRTTGQWSTLKSLTADTSYTWTAPSEGDWIFYIDAKDASGLFLAGKAMDVTVSKVSAPLTLDVSIDRVEAEVGSNILIKAKATGGSGDYYYTYKAYNRNTGAMTTLKANTKDTSYSWPAQTVGSWYFYVDVTDSNGLQLKSSAMAATVIEKTEALKLKTSIDAIKANVGQNVTIKAEATGGAGSYLYTYKVYNSTTNTWKTLKSLTTDASCVWTPDTKGSWNVYVEVKDAKGVTIQSNPFGVVVDAASSGSGGALSMDTSVSTIQAMVGDDVVIGANATGGAGNHRYTYMIRDLATGTWKTLQSSTTNTQYTWKAEKEGKWEVCVEVKDANGLTLRSSAITITVVKKVEPLSLKAYISTIYARVGYPVTMTLEVTGGEGDYTYTYMAYERSTGKTTKIVSKESQYTWYPNTTGTWTYSVDLLDKSGTVIPSGSIDVRVY